jgi:hypothetical protein
MLEFTCIESVKVKVCNFEKLGSAISLCWKMEMFSVWKSADDGNCVLWNLVRFLENERSACCTKGKVPFVSALCSMTIETDSVHGYHNRQAGHVSRGV